MHEFCSLLSFNRQAWLSAWLSRIAMNYLHSHLDWPRRSPVVFRSELPEPAVEPAPPARAVEGCKVSLSPNDGGDRMRHCLLFLIAIMGLLVGCGSNTEKVAEQPSVQYEPATTRSTTTAVDPSAVVESSVASTPDKPPYEPTSSNIWFAAAQGKIDDVRHFLKANRALLNQLDENGFAPLHRACSTGQLEVVEVLLDSAVEINVRQATHQGTPLQYAVDNGHTHVVTMLLDAGADVDAADDLGRTPLIWATMKSRSDIVRLLLNHEANVQAMMKGGRTALQFAQQKDNDEIAQLLTTAASVQSGTLDKRLAVALNKRQADIVAELLKRGAKLPPASAKLETVFHRAAAGGDLRMVQVLIPHIKDIDHRDHLGRTALMFAANAGHTHVVAELAKLGADVNLKTSGNWTALHVAVKAGQQETAQRLIDLGADFQMKNSQGKTPLALNPKMTFNLTRSKDVSASPGNASSAKNTASPLKDEPKRQGTLVMNDKTYRLQNAMAYTIVKQSRKLTTVVLSEKPAIQNVPDERRKGREPGAFVFGPRVKLRFDESGKLTYLNVVADNHSINIDRPNFVKTVFAVKNGKVRGTASMQNPQKPNFASASYRFDVTFDVEILRGEED